MVQPLEAYEGSALKGGQYPLGYIQPTTLSTNVLSTIMGTHTATFLVCATGVTSPPEVMSSPPAAWRVVCGCCFYEGLGHWLGVGGSFRSTLGSLRPLSGLCSLGSTKIFFFFSFTWTTCKIFGNIFSTFFLTFSKLFSNLTLTCIYMFFLLLHGL